MDHLTLNSNKCRTAHYDAATGELTLDFAKGDAAPKLYRYLGVPEAIWTEVQRKQSTQSHPDETRRESVGAYLTEAVTGGFKDTHIPFAFERLGQNGEVIERSAKPLKQGAA